MRYLVGEFVFSFPHENTFEPSCQMVITRWRLATVICAIFLTVLLTVTTSLAIMTARDTITLRKAVEKAVGVGSPKPAHTDLPIPSMPTSNTLHVAFARFAAELVARLENPKPVLTPPSAMKSLGTLSSNSGKFNGWILQPIDPTSASTLWIVFRGTSTKDEWDKDFDIHQVSFLTRMASRSVSRIAYPNLMRSPMRTETSLFNANVGVHSGFMDIYTSLRPIMLDALNATSFSRVCITGHSMGAAQALYATLDLTTLFPDVIFDTVVFGCPRVGNTAFAKAVLEPPNLNSLVILANTCDMVTDVPLAVQPILTSPYTPLVYTHPGPALHNFTDNRNGWIANHMIGVYMDYLSS